MSRYTLSHLGDGELRRDLAALVARDRSTTATLLAHLAEFDERRLYLPAAHPSMYSYCIGELRLCEQAAKKRIRAARAARRFPVMFEAVADGRLHLSAVVLLAPYLTPENADELLAAASHRTKLEIEELLSRRFPGTEVLALVETLPASARSAGGSSAPGRMENQHVTAPARVTAPEAPGAPACQVSPGTPGTHSRVAPLAPERYLLQLSVGQGTHDKLQHARNLLGRQVPSGDIAQVLDRALDALIEKLERRKFSATTRPRRSGRQSANPRHVPAHVKRAVWERDRGQCTFTSAAGQRCPERGRLEFDHATEVARGGAATFENLRLRCRAHNQYGAECAFGAGFMDRKREEAKRRARARGREREARTDEEALRRAEESRTRAAEEELITPLRLLGFSAAEARRAAVLCGETPGTPLEQRLRRALCCLRPRARTCVSTATHESGHENPV